MSWCFPVLRQYTIRAHDLYLCLKVNTFYMRISSYPLPVSVVNTCPAEQILVGPAGNDARLYGSNCQSANVGLLQKEMWSNGDYRIGLQAAD